MSQHSTTLTKACMQYLIDCLQIFSCVQTSELVHYAKKARSSLEVTPHLQRAIALFNGITQYVISIVLKGHSAVIRAKAFARFIKVAKVSNLSDGCASAFFRCFVVPAIFVVQVSCPKDLSSIMIILLSCKLCLFLFLFLERRCKRVS